MPGPEQGGRETLPGEVRALLRAGRVREADELIERTVAAAVPLERGAVAQQAGLFAQKEGQPLVAARWYRRAAELLPRDPEPRHDRGLALLEAGQVGLAAQAQREALALDPDHTGARAQLAAALEAIGDDAGAARELRELLSRLGPQPALSARLSAIEQAAARAAHHRLVGSPARGLPASPLIGTAFKRHPVLSPGQQTFEAPFGELHVWVEGPGAARGQGAIAQLALMFHDMNASLQRSDLSYGGTTEDEEGRRIPLDEFRAAATVFFAQACGAEPSRTRRLLDWLMTADAGLGPHDYAGVKVGWALEGEGPDKKYGLFATQSS